MTLKVKEFYSILYYLLAKQFVNMDDLNLLNLTQLKIFYCKTILLKTVCKHDWNKPGSEKGCSAVFIRAIRGEATVYTEVCPNSVQHQAAHSLCFSLLTGPADPLYRILQ